MGSAVVWVPVATAYMANVFVLGSWGLRRVGALATGRGHPGPALPAVVATVGAVEVLVGIHVVLGRPGSSWYRPVNLAALAVLLDATLLAGLLAARLLPRRPTRRGGRRRVGIPFRWCGRLLAVAALATVPVTQRLEATQGMGQVALLLGGLSVACHRADRRARQLSVDEVRAGDDRPPVLVLRPFSQDGEPFVLLDRPPPIPLWHRPAASLYRSLPLVDADVDRKPTFEAFVADEVRLALGPLTALGDPRDYLPPIGAARLYADDEGWQQQAAALIDAASGILTVVCPPSSSLTWELGYVRRTGAAGRLFVAIPPGGVAGPVWRAFSGELTRLGYTLGAGPPAPGAVLAFDRSARGHELTTGARTPADIVAPIARHLATSDPTVRPGP